MSEEVPLLRDVHTRPPGVLGLMTPCPRLDDVRLVIAGHSQAWALIHALVTPGHGDTRLLGPSVALAHGLAGVSTGVSATHARYWDFVLALGRSRDLAVVWLGNQVSGDFMFAPGRPFDFVPSRDPEAPLQEGALLVPESALRAHLQPGIDELSDFLARAAMPGRRRFVLGTPPPMFAAEDLRRGFAREPHFAALARSLGAEIDTLPITDGAVRRKIWQLLQDMMQDAAVRHGAVFIPAPADMLDAQGCLLPARSAGDASHSGFSYGTAQLRDLVRHLDTPADAAALLQDAAARGLVWADGVAA